ncbi:hypothetical protein H3C61_04295 [Candidatus Gracilibacteria bacterium]|nr:hypothetical protein [Candidatus Gracilibacteria bacterium]
MVEVFGNHNEYINYIDVKNVKNKILEIGQNKENTKINIFGFFVDLPDTELKKNLEIEFFKN